MFQAVLAAATSPAATAARNHPLTARRSCAKHSVSNELHAERRGFVGLGGGGRKTTRSFETWLTGTDDRQEHHCVATWSHRQVEISAPARLQSLACCQSADVSSKSCMLAATSDAPMLPANPSSRNVAGVSSQTLVQSLTAWLNRHMASAHSDPYAHARTHA